MIEEIGQTARAASKQTARASTAQKNDALEHLFTLLEEKNGAILSVNQQDIDDAKTKGLSDSMIDRLSLQGRLEGMRDDLGRVAEMGDPVGERFEARTLPNGLTACKQRCPIGVLGVIYESRPNVTLDIAALAIKTGNAVILRGGSETIRTNRALVQVIQEALQKAHLPEKAVQLIDNPDRALVKELLHLNPYVDMIVPRGGAELHRFCRDNSTIPVITGGIGVCHLYVDETADLDKSLEVVLNAKTQRPTVCNALDTLIVHRSAAPAFLPMVVARLKDAGVAFRFDEDSWQLLSEEQKSYGQQAQKEDFATEWLSLTLGVKVVASLEDAIAHIETFSTGHSDGILTQNEQHAQTFVREVDSSAVYVNASTRFTDGSQLGLGAEVAISTQKLHARGPMGLKEITTYKWVIEGNYTTRV